MAESRLDRWLNRDLSLWQHLFNQNVKPFKMYLPAYSLSISKAAKTINKLNYDYIWKRKAHYLKKATIVKDYEDGGLQAIDFDCINGSLKTKWFRSFLVNSNSFWYCVPGSCLEGLDVLISFYTVTLMFKTTSKTVCTPFTSTAVLETTVQTSFYTP